ncbi:MAG: hypothetical protein EP330_11580 [Deltaproteobacteria bacterium]|nr:MAG: hypothetical protein EP330_11580 [Deltaproteobacteria bacterium]
MFALLLVLLTAHADDGVCLSDGQLLTGTPVTFDTHLALPLPVGEVRIPPPSLGEGCPRPLTWASNGPRRLRELSLSNGDILHGAPRRVGDSVYLRLPDNHEITLTSDAITRQRGSRLRPPVSPGPRERHQTVDPLALVVWVAIPVALVTAGYLALRNADFTFMG